MKWLSAIRGQPRRNWKTNEKRLIADSSKPTATYIMNRRLHISTLLAALSLTVMLASCGEIYDLNGFDWQPDTPPSDSAFNREIQILDLGADNLPEGHRPLDGEDPLYFSLEKISSVHTGYKKSERWDVALGYAMIAANNGSYQGLGYGSSAIGGLVLVDSAYSQVMTVPDDDLFSVPGSSGLDNSFGSGPGHMLYTFVGNPFHPEEVAWTEGNDPQLVLEGNYYKHMMYPLSEGLAETYPGAYNGFTVKPKTVIVRTAAGNYAKIEIQSVYKGTLDYKQMSRKLPINYLSFRYMVIRADEKRFGFVARRPPVKVDMTAKTITVGE